MSNQKLPRNLNYNDIKPTGFPSHIKQQKFTPIAFNTSSIGVSSSDIIRFNISDNGFWDPYSAYIKIEVDVSTSDGVKNTTGSACGSLQVDNSAASFIQQMIIYNQGTEIERIEEYDTISAILNDMNANGQNRTARFFEGTYSQIVPDGLQYSNPRIGPTVNTGVLYGYSPLTITDIGEGLYSNQQPSITDGTNVPIQRYENTLINCEGKLTVQKPTSATYYNGLVTTNTPLTTGWQSAFCQSLSSLGNEALLSNNLVAQTTYKGNLYQPVYMNRQTFCIPILSGLLGVLMPMESYKYIPMKALQELIIEFRLSPYAMFTSGYADGASNASNTTGNALLALGTTTNPMLSRIWKINKFEINVEMQYFDQHVENIILSQLNSEKGIVIHTQSWLLGPRYQIAANASPVGTFQVNLGFESLKNVCWCYIPDEYTTYTFCRKQYRLSANITQMYIKVGSQYYPPLPITGHGGMCAGYSTVSGPSTLALGNDVDYNNSEFMIQLYKCFGKFHNVTTTVAVNPINFAVNDRAFNPTNLLALSSGTAYTNLDTTMSLPLFHENRCVGKAIYAMNLETLNEDISVISGINTINNRPFEITLKSDQVGAYTRSYTTYIFCNYDMLIQLRTSGVQILGRG